MKKEDTTYPCPCCRFLTLSEPCCGTFEICPVCGWEDDEVQYKNPNYSGGANQESLYQAQENFKMFGASSKNCVSLTRKPFPKETP